MVPRFGGAVVLVLLLFLAAAPSAAPGAPADSKRPPAASAPAQKPVDDLFDQLQKALESGNRQAYLDLFTPAAREVEAPSLESRFADLGMTSIKLRQAGKAATDASGVTRVFAHAFFQNDYEAMLEAWRFVFAETPEGWRVAAKDVASSVGNLLKIKIPGGPVERAASVEVRHADIVLTFRDALVYHDNIPGLETGLIVLGPGRIDFTPSHPVERHLMDVFYRKPSLQGAIEGLYLRSSNAFIASNVTVRGAHPVALESLPAEETARASALFSRNYDRSFTLANSIDGALLSMLPQGEEAVFEIKGKDVGELTYVYSPYAEDEISLYDRTRDRFISLYSPQDDPEPGGAPPLKRMVLRVGEQFEVDDIRLDLAFDPGRSYLSGRARVRVNALSDGVGNVKFRFAPELAISKIQDGRGRELFFTQDALRKSLYVYLLEPVRRDAPEDISIFYRGRLTPPPPSTDTVAAGGQESRFIYKPRYDTFLYASSAFWYPSATDESYFTARMRISVPSEYQCIAVGESLEGSGQTAQDDASTTVYEYATRQPVKSLAFFVGRMYPTRSGDGALPVRAFASVETTLMRRDFYDDARQILSLFARTFGPFPYEKLDVVHRMWPSAGGHSPASFVVVNELPWIGDRPPVAASGPVTFPEFPDAYFLAHEIAHQWWGQGVGWETYRDQWLSEGLAQYAAGLYVKERFGEKAYASVLRKFARWTAKKSSKGPVTLGSRLSYYDFEGYQAIVYDKAALALDMLSRILGPPTFSAGLRDFFETRKFTLARTDQFVQSMQAACGRNLKAFFDGWFQSYELPKIRVETTARPAPEGGGWEMKVRVRQQGTPFVFPLVVEWMENGKPVRGQVVAEGAIAEATLRTETKPEKVKVDPDKIFPGEILR